MLRLQRFVTGEDGSEACSVILPDYLRHSVVREHSGEVERRERAFFKVGVLLMTTLTR